MKNVKKIIRNAGKSMWKYLNKEMSVKYMAIWFFLIMFAVFLFIIIRCRTRSVFIYGDTTEFTGLSNWCYDKKDEGKYCLVEQKVYWFEKTREEME